MSDQIEKGKTTKISKFLSLILRHKPETIGLNLDDQGWADVDTLIDLVRQSGKGHSIFVTMSACLLPRLLVIYSPSIRHLKRGTINTPLLKKLTVNSA